MLSEGMGMTAHIDAASPAKAAGREGRGLHICMVSRATARGGEMKHSKRAKISHPWSKVLGAKNLS